MAEEIKAEVEATEVVEQKAEKVKKTPGQKLDAALEAVAGVPKKIAGGGKKAVAAVGVGLLTAFGTGVLLGSKGYFTASEDDGVKLVEGDGYYAVIDSESDVIDVEPVSAETEKADEA